MSLEKEVFPFMAQDGQLFAFDLDGISSVPTTMIYYVTSPLFNQFRDLGSMYSMYYTYEYWMLEKMM